MNERTRRVSEMLAQAGVDLLVCRLPENVLFLSGYWPNTGDSLAAITRDGTSALFIPVSDRRYAESSWVREIVTTTANELERFSGWLLAGMDALAGWVGDRFAGGVIGYEGSFETVAGSHIGGEVTVPSAAWRRVLEEYFRARALEDLTEPIRRARIVKTREELARIRLANRIASQALDLIIPKVKPGLRECEVAAMVESEVGSTGYGFETVMRARGYAFVQSGPTNPANGWWPFSISSERVIQDGDSVLIELDAHADGYWCDLTRSFVVGTASPAQAAMRAAVRTAHQCVIQALRSERPTCARLDEIARQALRREFPAEAFPHKIGHGVGFAFHELPLLHPKVQDEIPLGAVLAIEPGLYVPGVGGYRLEDNVHVGEEGPEILTTARVP